jgi:hypothetical protein
LLSGQQLINELNLNGVNGIGTFLDSRGLHAPYSTIIAAISLWLTNGNIASVYYANALIVILYLLGISYFIWRIKPLLFAVLLLLFLTPPILTMGVVEFRPDILWGLLTGFAAVWIITEDKIFTSPKHSLFAGLLLGIDLLVKPSTFALTILVICTALLSRFLKYLYLQKEPKIYRSWLQGILTVVSVAIIIAGPYFFKYGNDIWVYFFDNCFGKNKELWATKITLIDSLKYYINGPGALDNLGTAGIFYFFAFIYLSSNIIIFEKNLRFDAIVISIAIICTIFVNSVSDVKGPFSGGVIYGLLMFGSAYLMGQQQGFLSLDRRYIIAIFIAITIFTYAHQWPKYSLWTENGAIYKKSNDSVKSLLVSDAVISPSSILFMQTGPIVPQTIALTMAFKNKNILVESGALFRSTEDFYKAYSNYQWVILQDPGVQGGRADMPSEKILPACLNLMSLDKNYCLLKKIAASKEKYIYIYSKN